MFGYILPLKEELKIKEYNQYKWHYCGLCRSLKELGPLAPMVLNYDLTFLSLLLSGLEDKPFTHNSQRCISKPMSKCSYITNATIDFAARINIMLTYHKLMDDWKDEHNRGAFIASKLLKGSYKKAASGYSDIDGIIKAGLSELSKLEAEKCSNVDKAGHSFAKILEGIIINSPLLDQNQTQALGWLGYNVGKWIYTIDCYDDLEEDIKNNSYNPIILQYNYNDEDIQDFKSKVKEDIRFTLMYCLGQITSTFDLLTLYNNQSILENIFYLGLHDRTDKILEGRKCNHGQSLRNSWCKKGSF